MVTLLLAILNTFHNIFFEINYNKYYFCDFIVIYENNTQLTQRRAMMDRLNGIFWGRKAPNYQSTKSSHLTASTHGNQN